jgi:parallel beta-helix repeat protein
MLRSSPNTHGVKMKNVSRMAFGLVFNITITHNYLFIIKKGGVDMKIASGRGLLILVTFSLILSIFATAGTTGVVQASGPTYSSHSIITINNNSDLTTLRSQGACTGSGMVNDPYVIDGYDISGNGGACIHVAHITVRLVISNCYLHDSSYGVELVGSNFVTVKNNNCSGNDPYGIYLDNTGNDTLINNVCLDASHGIYSYGSGDNVIKNNTCRGTRACAMMLTSSSNRNLITENTCYSSGNNGIHVLRSDHNTITYNTLKNNGGFGLSLANSDHNVAYGNLMIGNNGSSSIYNASHIQSNDTGVDNHWNTSSYGNYWSDWKTPDANGDGIVDNPYSICDGSSKDYYPLTTTTIPGKTVPSAPTGMTATIGDRIVSLSWGAPSDGRAPIDYYIVYQDGIDVAHPTTNSTTISGLANGQSYTFKVAAHNSVGMGAESSGVSATPNRIPTVPSIPIGLVATPGNGQVSISWSAPSSNGGAIIDYYIVYQNGTDVRHPSGTSVTITGLTNGQDYGFTVAAHNSAGIGSLSSGITASPYQAPTIPGIPLGLTTTPGNDQISLSWAVPTNSSDIDYYIIYVNGFDVRHTSATSTTITGLINGESYSFAVAAHNSGGLGNRTSVQTISPGTASTKNGSNTIGTDTLVYIGVSALLAAMTALAFVVWRKRRNK